MSRQTIIVVLVIGFVLGVVGAAVIWAVQHGAVSENGAHGYAAALRLDLPRMTPGLLVFLLFALYWSFAAGDSAGADSAEPRWSTALHRGLVLASVAAILLPIPGLSARFAPDAGWVVAAGLAVELAGVVLAVLARRALGRNWSSEVRLAADHELVRSGVYRRLRHPIYTGALLIYLGLVLQSGTAERTGWARPHRSRLLAQDRSRGAYPSGAFRRSVRRLAQGELGPHPAVSVMARPTRA